MNNELISKLNKLRLEKACVKRELDKNYYNYNLRNKLFTRVKSIDYEIKKVEFKIRLEREKKKNENISD